MGTLALPFDNLSFSVSRPQSPAYPEELRTIGDHLRARRLDLDLYQKEVAAQLGATTDTVYNWEQGRTEPDIRQWPAVVAFLGYYPFPTEATAERILAYRRCQGLSIAEVAALLSVDPSSVGRWEGGQEPRNRRNRERLHELLNNLDPMR